MMRNISQRVAGLALLVVAAFAVTLPASAQPKRDWEECTADSESLAAADLSIAACTRAIQARRYSGADLATLYGNRGTQREFRKDFTGGLEDLNKAIELAPDSASLFDARGKLYRRRPPPDHASALADFTRAIALDPKEARYYLHRADAYSDLTVPDFDRAIADYTQAILLDPTSAAAFNDRGTAYVNRDRSNVALAIADFTQAIALDPEYTNAYVNRGFAYVFLSPPDYTRAIADFSKAVELDPENPDNRSLLDMARQAQADPNFGKQ